MSTPIFLLVLGSALCHAAWNFAARRVSGNFVVFWISLWIGCLFLFPITVGLMLKLGLSQTIKSSGLPYILYRYGDSIVQTAKITFKSSLIIGTGSILTYLMILFAFTLGPVSYIVAVREFAVVFGALAGMIFLKEKFSIIKILAIIGITIGMVCIKIV